MFFCVQIKDAVRDGLRAVKNVLDDGAVVAGAGAFEARAAAEPLSAGSIPIALSQAPQLLSFSVALRAGSPPGLVPGPDCHAASSARSQVALNQHLLNDVRKTVQGRVKLGVQAFADAVMIVPKTLAENSGFETQDVTIALQEEVERGNVAGLDIDTGEPCDPTVAGIYDNYIVKVQIINSACVHAPPARIAPCCGGPGVFSFRRSRLCRAEPWLRRLAKCSDNAIVCFPQACDCIAAAPGGRGHARGCQHEVKVGCSPSMTTSLARVAAAAADRRQRWRIMALRGTAGPATRWAAAAHFCPF